MKKGILFCALATMLFAGGGSAFAAQGIESFKGEELITEDGIKSTFVSDEEKQSRATDGPIDGGIVERMEVV